MINTRNVPRETMAAGFDALFSNMLNGAAHLKACRDKSARIIDFTFLNVNRAWEKVIGVRRSRVINRNMSEVFPDFNTDWCRFAEQVLAKKKGVQFQNSNRNRERWYNVSIYTPQAEEIMLIFDDITEFQKAQDRMRETEEKVRSSEQKFKSIIEQSGDGIVLIDAKGAIVEYNPMMERISGIPRSQAIGRKIWDLQYEFLPKGKRSSQAFKMLKKTYADLFNKGTADWLNRMRVVVIQRPDGVVIELQHVVSPIIINGEHLYVAFSRDVTDLRKAEKELEEQNRQLEAKNTALLEVMERLEAEKKRIVDQVRSNVERLVLPLLGRLSGRGTDEDRKYLALLEANLREITAGFGNAVSANMNRLTQKETEICDMIKRGLSCKEIGRLMSISHRTAETHRNRIRKKLEIADPSVNLQTYLKNLQNG